ncbi:hypothetical protein EP1X_09170 [Thermococcus sp. EP1]|uniref:hypothetical protein n=1 Tax=Thermococcus sp. EP1 TaxID=1591054 RepID=UPI0006DB5EA9|nr:hypothetical protein [Thermococcus sp. EP1]KPU62372.1 hypothetical protein EP1X_09170 [Thermococcus sp. EP1]
MKIEDVFDIVQSLEAAEVKITAKGIRKVIREGGRRLMYTGSNGTEVYIIRTDKICPGDFKVVLKPKDKKEFAPTHIRLFFDLYLKKISDWENAKKLFFAFEKVNRGVDIEEALKEIKNLKFPMELDPSDVTLFYGFLLLAEQEWNYGKQGCRESRMNPAREFLMRFIRWLALSDYGDIDKVVTMAVRNKPPKSGFEKPLEELLREKSEDKNLLDF